MKISGTLRRRFLPWKSSMVNEPTRIGLLASKLERNVALPASRAAAVVNTLNTEPSS